MSQFQKKFQQNHVAEIQKNLISSIRNHKDDNSVNFECEDGVISCDTLILALTSEYWRELLNSNESNTAVIIAPDYITSQIRNFLHFFVTGETGYEKEKNRDPEKEKDKERFRKDLRQFGNRWQEIKKFDTKPKSSLACPYCLKVFSAAWYIKKHIKNAHPQLNPKSYKCDKCDMTFQTKEGLKAHDRNTHLNKDPHICRTCHSVYGNRNELLRHCKTEGHSFPKKNTPEKGFERCKLCAKDIQSDLIDEHMRRYHPSGKTHKCSDCKFTTKRLDSLHRHRRLVHFEFNKELDAIDRTIKKGKTYKCIYCKQMLTTEKEIDEHLVREVCKMKCKICDKEFTLKHNMNRHMKKFHSKTSSEDTNKT